MHILWMALITLGILQLSALCTTVYLHRSITHRGLRLHPAVAFLMHLELLVFTGISPREWAAVHRKHHHFSDKEGDQHSPSGRALDDPAGKLFPVPQRGGERRNSAEVHARLQTRHPGQSAATWIWRFYWTGSVYTDVRIGLGCGGVGCAVVVYIAVNAMVNGLGHMIGYRNFDNQATNLQWLALISAGEALHNNHHEYPTSARLAMRVWEFDPAWPVIRLLEILGLAEVKPESLAGHVLPRRAPKGKF